MPERVTQDLSERPSPGRAFFLAFALAIPLAAAFWTFIALLWWLVKSHA